MTLKGTIAQLTPQGLLPLTSRPIKLGYGNSIGLTGTQGLTGAPSKYLATSEMKFYTEQFPARRYTMLKDYQASIILSGVLYQATAHFESGTTYTGAEITAALLVDTSTMGTGCHLLNETILVLSESKDVLWLHICNERYSLDEGFVIVEKSLMDRYASICREDQMDINATFQYLLQTMHPTQIAQLLALKREPSADGAAPLVETLLKAAISGYFT